MTDFGRCRYLRLPFGIKSAPEVMHETISQMFDNIEGVECYIADILIWGKDQAEHDARLIQVLETCRFENLTLNKNKCHISQTTVKFIGHELKNNVLAPSRYRIQSVLDMPMPTTKEEIQRFIGFATYLSKCCPRLYDATKSVLDVLKKNLLFYWEKPQEEAFIRVNQLVTDSRFKIQDIFIRPVVSTYYCRTQC